MRILGIDPGSLKTGYGIIEIKGRTHLAVTHGLIKLQTVPGFPERLDMIFSRITELVKKYRPDEFSIETAFYGKNVQSALKIGLARGAAIVAATQSGLGVFEYSPREIKKAVTGNGAASKEQVYGMVNSILQLKNKIVQFDETDALAAALCRAFRANQSPLKTGSWKSFIEQNPERIIK